MASDMSSAGSSTSSCKSWRSENLCCSVCGNVSQDNDILRLLLRERLYHVSVLIIRLITRNGVASKMSTKIANFLKISHNKQSGIPLSESLENISCSKIIDALDCFHTYRRRPFCIKHNRRFEWKTSLIRHRTRANVQAEDKDEELVTSFVERLAEVLRVKTFLVNETVDNIMTSFSEIVVDFNLQRLKFISRRTENALEDIIINMFWQPRVKHDDMSSKNPRKGWFRSVDMGYVVPSDVLPFYHICSYKPIEQCLFVSCKHIIEQTSTDFISWYIEPYFYQADSSPMPNSFERFEKESRKTIVNSHVTIVDDNPLSLSYHMAHVVASNLYSNQRYIREYLSNTAIFNEPFVHLQQSAPYIVRSLNSENGFHIFHLIYKNTTYERSTYECLFKLLTLLRDVLLRMKIFKIVMPKFGCGCDNLTFRRVIKMIKFVFRHSHIRVFIGLKSKEFKCLKCYKANDPIKEENEDDVYLPATSSSSSDGGGRSNK